jgi:SAM-dependent methyltransferase
MASYASLFDAGPVLDIGAGRGFFVEALLRRGIECIGVDVSQEAAAAAKSLGVEVIVQDAFEFLLSGREFKGLFLAHVVEHLPIGETERLLKLANSALLPGGMIVVVTPNFRDPLVSGEIFWLDPTHVRPYPSPLLRAMLEEQRFIVEDAGLGKIRHARSALPRIALGRLRYGRHFGRPELYVIARKPARTGSGAGQEASAALSTGS